MSTLRKTHIKYQTHLHIHFRIREKRTCDTDAHALSLKRKTNLRTSVCIITLRLAQKHEM